MTISRTMLIALGACFVNGFILGLAHAPGWAGWAVALVVGAAFLLAEREFARRIRVVERLATSRPNLHALANMTRTADTLNDTAARSARRVVR